jgi:hypothetical protein
MTLHEMYNRFDRLEPGHAFRRQALERWGTVWNEMKTLALNREYRHLRAAINRRIVQRPDLQDHRGQSRPPRGHVRTAFATEFACNRVSLVGSDKRLRRTFRVAESVGRHQHEQVRLRPKYADRRGNGSVSRRVPTYFLTLAAVPVETTEWRQRTNQPHRYRSPFR